MSAVAALLFGLVWAYVALAPMMFLDDEYPRWTAKIHMLDACDLGDVVVLGDSRVAVGIAPLALGRPAVNLSFAGTSGIELSTVVDRMLRCPRLPGRVILSISPPQLYTLGTFWDKSVRYRLLGLRELEALLRESEAVHDMSVFTTGDRDGLPPRAKLLLHASLFPSLYFNSLVQGRGAGRYGRNMGIYDEVLASRGQYFFAGGAGQGSYVPVPEAAAAAFQAPRIFTAYLDRLLGRLGERGVRVDYVAMPVNATSRSAMAPMFTAGLDAYLRGFERGHPNFRVLGDTQPFWPDPLFNDSLAHFNVQGTALMSARLAECLAAAAPATPLADTPACKAIYRQPPIE